VTKGYFYYQDSLGNTSHVTDAVGNLLERYTYSAFGIPTFYNAAGAIIYNAVGISQSALGIRHLFQGQLWTQETELNDYRNRVELPIMGVFLQPDPIGFKGDAANIYRFCNNNAVNRIDPMGLINMDAGASLTSWGNGEWIGNSDGIDNQTLMENKAQRDQNAGMDRGGGGSADSGGSPSAEKSQGGVRHGDGYGSSPVEAGLLREQDAKKIARGDTEGVSEIGRDKANPNQFWANPAHDGNKKVENFKDKVKRDNAPVATSAIDPSHLPSNYRFVGAVLAMRLFSAQRAAEDIQRAKDHGWQTFIITAPERKVPVVYDKNTNPNPTF
jgi:RHS repeat-associated protein